MEGPVNLCVAQNYLKVYLEENSINRLPGDEDKRLIRLLYFLVNKANVQCCAMHLLQPMFEIQTYHI